MADKRAYFKLDVGYLTNPKVAAVAFERPTAVLLHIASMGYAAQHLTDGIVPIPLLLRMYGCTQKDAEILAESGLWVLLEGSKAEVHDYLEHQRSASEVKDAADKAKRAADARWNASSNASSMPDALPNAMRGASVTSMPREREEKERDKDTHSAAAEAEFAAFWAEYPKKRDKGHAVKAYRSARKKASSAVILAGLRQQVPEWRKSDPKFIPLAATWLNGERWNDEPDATVHQIKPDAEGRIQLPPLPSKSPWGP